MVRLRGRFEELVSSRRLPWLAFLAALAVIPIPGAASSQDAARQPEHSPAADLVIRGRVLNQSSEPLPQKSGEVLLASLWTYEVRVVRVIRGDEPNRTITAKGEADPALRKDVDLTFYLTRAPDGAYRVEKVTRGAESPP